MGDAYAKAGCHIEARRYYRSALHKLDDRAEDKDVRYGLLAVPLSILLEEDAGPLPEDQKRLREIHLIERLLELAEIPNAEDLDDQQTCLEQLCSCDLQNASLR